MTDDHRTPEISSVHVWRHEATNSSAERGDLACSDDLEDKEEGEDEGERKCAEAGVDVQGWEEHEDHDGVEDLAASVDFYCGRENEDGGETDEEDENVVEDECEAGV